MNGLLYEYGNNLINLIVNSLLVIKYSVFYIFNFNVFVLFEFVLYFGIFMFYIDINLWKIMF